MRQWRYSCSTSVRLKTTSNKKISFCPIFYSPYKENKIWSCNRLYTDRLPAVGGSAIWSHFCYRGLQRDVQVSRSRRGPAVMLYQETEAQKYPDMNLKWLCSCTRWQVQCVRCVNRCLWSLYTLYVFWYMSPTFLHTAPVSWCLHETEMDFTTEIIAHFWLYGGHWRDDWRSYVQTQQLLSQTIQGDRFIQGLADSSEEDAHGRHSPWPLRMFSIKQIYYDSRPTPIHALISICSVVRAVCYNLLLF